MVDKTNLFKIKKKLNEVAKTLMVIKIHRMKNVPNRMI